MIAAAGYTLQNCWYSTFANFGNEKRIDKLKTQRKSENLDRHEHQFWKQNFIVSHPLQPHSKDELIIYTHREKERHIATEYTPIAKAVRFGALLSARVSRLHQNSFVDGINLHTYISGYLYVRYVHSRNGKSAHFHISALTKREIETEITIANSSESDFCLPRSIWTESEFDCCAYFWLA